MIKLPAYLLILMSIIVSGLAVGWMTYARFASEFVSWGVFGFWVVAVLAAYGVATDWDRQEA